MIHFEFLYNTIKFWYRFMEELNFLYEVNRRHSAAVKPGGWYQPGKTRWSRTVKLSMTAFSRSSCFEPLWYYGRRTYPWTSKNTCVKLFLILRYQIILSLWLEFYEKFWNLFKTENEWADSDQWSKNNCKEHFELSNKLRVRLSTSLHVPNSLFSGRSNEDLNKSRTHI